MFDGDERSRFGLGGSFLLPTLHLSVDPQFDGVRPVISTVFSAKNISTKRRILNCGNKSGSNRSSTHWIIPTRCIELSLPRFVSLLSILFSLLSLFVQYILPKLLKNHGDVFAELPSMTSSFVEKFEGENASFRFRETSNDDRLHPHWPKFGLVSDVVLVEFVAVPSGRFDER